MWRQGSRQRSKTFDRKGDATRFATDLARRRQLGAGLSSELDRSEMTLADFVAGPHRAHAANLSAASRAGYGWALEKHLFELLDQPLRAIDVPMLARIQRDMLDKGATATTVREVMVRLSGILQLATEHGLMPGNPALSLRRPRIEARAEVDPLNPRELEILIASFEGRSRVICVLSGHLGLRPLEVRAVTWASLGDGVLVVGRSMTKKAAQRMRSIAVPAITGQELREWRMRAGRPADNERIVPMTESGLRSWGKQVLRPAISARPMVGLLTVLSIGSDTPMRASCPTPTSASLRLPDGWATALDFTCRPTRIASRWAADGGPTLTRCCPLPALI